MKIEKQYTKNLNDTFIYNLSDMYTKNIVKAVLEGERINKASPQFKDVIYDVNRKQNTSVVSKVLQDPNVVLVKLDYPMPRAMKVFTVKDLKQGPNAESKVFIDVSDIMKLKDDSWYCWRLDILVAYLISAMAHLSYYQDPLKLRTNSVCMQSGTTAFAKMYTYIVDYLFKISSIETNRNKCMFLAAMYYQCGICGKAISDESAVKMATKLSKLSEREVELVTMYIKDDSFVDINHMVSVTSDVLKLSKLTVNVFLDKWIYIFGAGTHFSLEIFTSFATMLTDTYTGCYLNNQKTIEKVVGDDMIKFTKNFLSIGGSVL